MAKGTGLTFRKRPGDRTVMLLDGTRLAAILLVERIATGRMHRSCHQGGFLQLNVQINSLAER